MSYNSFLFIGIYLPVCAWLYAHTSQKKRWIILLAASLLFYITLSSWLLAVLLGEAFVTWIIGRKMAALDDMDEKPRRHVEEKRRLARYGIWFLLLILIVLKYTNFVLETIFSIVHLPFQELSIFVPLGISYYTLQAISYLCDVRDKKIAAQPCYWRLVLYLSFFPTIMEGPITRYREVEKQLFAGNDITYTSLCQGSQRILWGMFKKIVLADHMNTAVKTIFTSFTGIGKVTLLGAILCTLQLYMDFSGTIDIAMGAARTFGIFLPENFRQPFFAKDAADFWRRWHITLGTWLRDYVFYPVSLSKGVMKLTRKMKKYPFAARYIGPSLALFAVWLGNGLWHGPKWTYVLYGMYYFVLMEVEMLLMKPMAKFYEKKGIEQSAWWLRIVRFIKVFVIVMVGELFFRAPSFTVGWTMLKAWFVNFQPGFSILKAKALGGMDPFDILTVCMGMIIVLIVDILKEGHISIRQLFSQLPLPIRWIVWYTAILVVLVFGAYGPGYDAVMMMYAGF